ncbi:hypothetical protein M0802_013511 [Mischocyttarus mexicanus]|nr:hypothetical protein M0802_013511 [Mischocyttarus mexicanus]
MVVVNVVQGGADASAQTGRRRVLIQRIMLNDVAGLLHFLIKSLASFLLDESLSAERRLVEKREKRSLQTTAVTSASAASATSASASASADVVTADAAQSQGYLAVLACLN